jgi:hypothetical protein
MTRPIFFSDLDDTIFQTARKMPVGSDPGVLACKALNGSHSYMTRAQALMMDWLLASTRFIPVTARSTEALARCRLPFRDHRICTNGAIILLPDGTPDPEWRDRTRQQAKDAAPVLDALLAFVQHQTETGRYRCWVVEECGTGYYFCVKSNGEAAMLDGVDDHLAEIAGDGFTRHRNDNNLSFTPAGISKRHAVEYLSQMLVGDDCLPVFGMGDSLTDLPFMALCDMMVVPRGSQIDRIRLPGGAP